MFLKSLTGVMLLRNDPEGGHIATPVASLNKKNFKRPKIQTATQNGQQQSPSLWVQNLSFWKLKKNG